MIAVRNVGDIEAKVKGAYHRDLRRLVLPGESRLTVERSQIVPREVSRELVRYANTLDEALEHVFGVTVWVW